MSCRLEFFRHCEFDDTLCLQWQSLAVSPFESPGWLLTWREHFAPDSELFLAIWRDETGAISHLAPLYKSKNRVALLGEGITCTDHLQLLVGNVSTAQTEICLSDIVAHPDFSGCHLYLESIDTDSNTVQAIQQCADIIHATTNPVGSAQVNLPADWDSYLAILSKNHRYRVRKWWRRHFESGATHRKSTRDGWSAEPAFATLLALHKERRATLQYTAADTFDNPVFVQFLRQAFSRLCQFTVTTPVGVTKPMAEISGLVIDDIIVAVEFELHSATHVYAYQSGMSPQFTGESIGSVSVVSRIRAALDDGQTVYDLGRGLEDYKFHWKAQSMTASDYFIWPASLSGRVRRTSAKVSQISRKIVSRLASSP